MAEEIAGRGDPVRTLELMWGKAPAPRRGPKSRVSVADLVAAAVTIADADGIDAVSTRRVAEAVGISPMSFYTHIPDKAVLLDLMLDAVASPPGEDTPANPAFDPAEWRANVTFVARAFRAFYLRHPWVLQVGTHRPVLGPNTMRAYDVFLSAFDGIGLSEVEMDLSVTMVANYVHGAVRDVARAHMVKEQTGKSDDEWWYTIAPFLETIDFSPYPVANRVGPVVGELYGLGDPDLAFDFGLERLLDGLERLIEGKASSAVVIPPKLTPADREGLVIPPLTPPRGAPNSGR
ncbi:TetR/AcrR family transcriptional regulator [Devosia sp. ZB163]|uniref:TetR/AcrR family transcriptional regulator n=1 Tax=Devosia sp. ZB163 TaxID=3025938 RepID=UPI00235F15C4|nr:TetR/AcrR family transcriptional regulator [Devosia sp. ZB163]MDC9822559.1 TetR/AcrR family transcriptional regulator [Devosia sp. ZB163]